jgi:hypothetical protein
VVTPASAYEFAVQYYGLKGSHPKIIDNGGYEVDVEFTMATISLAPDSDKPISVRFFRTQEACNRAVEEERAKTAAERQRDGANLDPYR